MELLGKIIRDMPPGAWFDLAKEPVNGPAWVKRDDAGKPWYIPPTQILWVDERRIVREP